LLIFRLNFPREFHFGVWEASNAKVGERVPLHTIITIDNDFCIYRRNKREAIPLLCAPKR
jgi:hypothetical protein